MREWAQDSFAVSMVVVPMVLLIGVGVAATIYAIRHRWRLLRVALVGVIPSYVGLVLWGGWVTEDSLANVLQWIILGCGALFVYMYLLDRAIVSAAAKSMQGQPAVTDTSARGTSPETGDTAGRTPNQRRLSLSSRWLIAVPVVLVAGWILWTVWGVALWELLAF